MQADLLHPLTSLEWRKCAETPFGLYDAQAVCVNRRVYVGVGFTPSSATNYTILCYDNDADYWTSIKSPTCFSALATYQGKLVLVGGEDDTEHATNQLWSLLDDDRWSSDELPPMPTPRRGASAVNTGSYLIVAGGVQLVGSFLNVVEVFDGRQWTRTESLPEASWNMKSTLHNGEWYLMGGASQGKSLFYATVDSLIATAESSEGEGGSVWKTLPEAPLKWSSIAMYGNLLLAIGGRDSSFSLQSAIYGYVTGTRTWVHIGDLPVLISSTCSIVLPSSELLVVGGWSGIVYTSYVFKATLRADPFQLDGQLSVTALSRLQYTVGVPVFNSIGGVWGSFAQSLTMDVVSMQALRPFNAAGPEVVGREVVKRWLSGGSGKPPTWRSLVEVMASLPPLAPLAETINRLFVIPLLENKIGELEHHLHRHEETIQQLREERQVALQREEAVVRKKEKLLQQLSSHPLPVQLEPGIKQEPVKQEVLGDPVHIKKEEEEGEEEMAIKKTEQIKEAHIMLEEDLAKCRLQKQESEMRCHEMQKELKELQSQLNTAVTDRDTDALAERDRALEERDKLRMELEQKEAISMGFLRGVDVVAETSLKVSSQACTYHWEAYGVKLHIPQDSLPADCQRCRVEMRASLSGHYALPAGCELVSGVYWMYCPVKLCKRVTLEVQHCSKQTERLSFVRANCTQEQLPYTFQSVETGVFSESSSYGSIELSRFSGWAILKSLFSRSSGRRYWAQVCYRRVEEGMWDVRFVVTWKLKAHIEAAHQELESETDSSFTVGLQFETAFDEFIELDIPREGQNENGWEIKPSFYPRISRSQVDSFKPGEFFHHCTLQARNTGSKSPLVLDVTMKGVREGESTFFTCVIGPRNRKRGPPSPSSSPASLSGPTTPEADGRGGDEAGTRSQDQPAETAPQSKKPRLSPSVEDNSEGPSSSGLGNRETQNTPLPLSLHSPPNLKDLLNKVAFKIPSKWWEVGLQLGLPSEELDAISEDHPNSRMRRFGAVFAKWQKMDKTYTWCEVLKALKSPLVAEKHLARKLEQWLSSSSP